MKIGIDLDGVVIDSETTFRTYEEIFDIDILNGNNLINREEPKFQARYNWTKEQEKEFIEKYFLKISKESNLMSGFMATYELLKQQGHEFVVITEKRFLLYFFSFPLVSRFCHLIITFVLLVFE